ncbi:valine--tRNA ligase [Pseudogemmobacter blasticus]|uniref:Valine--tRNA ligase n=1 Tax=Fuscovulum blasticum DSM 2131 TaxID=1188250 RepID=A0A2T4J5L2_FUSBL|nr:valine--tRNA ligase [Fuscovulum blasticum]PTE13189.1 valine--tRNA ligase [Fuscovulum blasticum DSM 2131]
MPMEKTFNAAEAEARLSKLWLESKAFAAGANAKPGHPAFSIMIPPPNVTGSLHMGHAFNNTLQDILVRWHRMRGDDTLWQPGTDHAGIATQMVTERELAKTNRRRSDFTREEFTGLVWDQKRKSRGTIIGQLQRLGASCDWDREAFTMSGAPGAPEGEEGNFHDAVIKVFVDLYNKGLIYRGKRLVNWDPHFETAISDLEVEQTEVAGHMWHFKYPLAGGETYIYREKDAGGRVILEEERDYISIATTRPETMLGDGAVAVHPSDERYAPIVGKLCEIPVGPKEHRRLIPIITDEYPDPNFGSGAVKITGAHDFNDYGVAARNDIPCYRLMDTRAQMRADGLPYDQAAAIAQRLSRAWLVAKGYATPGIAEQPFALSEAEIDALNLVPDDLRGLDRYEARKRVVEQINAEGLAVTVLQKSVDKETGAEHLERVPYVEAKPIMQPFGDRSKVVIEPMLTDQWFVDTAKIVEPALDAVRTGKTKIIPPSGEKTYYHWLENIEPWCISRQLWWGHQIPVWYGFDLSAPGFTDDEGDQALDNVEILRVLGDGGPVARETSSQCAADFTAVSDRFRDDLAALPHPLNHARIVEVADRAAAAEALAASLAAYEVDQDATRLTYPVWRDPDVLDTWFSSGLWPIGTLGWPEQTPELQRYFPTSVLITGQDILFFWVARMMMMQLAVVDEIPFHTVYLHGLVRDAKGKKMSKSLGNVIDPLEIIDEFGADALRFANAAMASLGGVLKMDTSRIAGYRNFGTKLWNACRFAEMNGVWEGHATQSAPPAPKATANRWIIGETARTLAEVNAALADFRFDQAADALYRFVWGKVCDWYVEFAKPLFDGPDAAETRATMAWVLDQSMILLHPFMPFITEDLWGTTGTRAKLLVHTDWPTYGLDLVQADAQAEMGFVTGLIEEIRSARAQVHVPVGLKIDLVATELSAAARAAWERNEAIIRRLARIDSFAEGPAPKGAIALALEGAAFAIPLAGLIDIAEEKARLQKTLDKLRKEIGGLKGRLDNPNFVKSAPEDVVEEAKSNLEAREDEAAKVDAALKRLADLG